MLISETISLLFIICFWSKSIAQQIKDCPSGPEWKWIPGKCIYITSELKSMRENRAMCKKMGATMVMTKSMDEYKYLQNFLKTQDSNARYWMGIIRRSLTDIRWVDDVAVTLPNEVWETGNPQSPEVYSDYRECIVHQTSNGKINGADCVVQNIQMCEKASKFNEEEPTPAEKEAIKKVAEVAEKVKQANQKLDDAVKEGKATVDKVKNDINNKLKDEADKAQQREKEFSSKLDNTKKDMENKVKAATDDINNKIKDAETKGKKVAEDATSLKKQNDQLFTKLDDFESDMSQKQVQDSMKVNKMTNEVSDMKEDLKKKSQECKNDINEATKQVKEFETKLKDNNNKVTEAINKKIDEETKKCETRMNSMKEEFNKIINKDYLNSKQVEEKFKQVSSVVDKGIQECENNREKLNKELTEINDNFKNLKPTTEEMNKNIADMTKKCNDDVEKFNMELKKMNEGLGTSSSGSNGQDVNPVLPTSNCCQKVDVFKDEMLKKINDEKEKLQTKLSDVTKTLKDQHDSLKKEIETVKTDDENVKKLGEKLTTVEKDAQKSSDECMATSNELKKEVESKIKEEGPKREKVEKEITTKLEEVKKEQNVALEAVKKDASKCAASDCESKNMQIIRDVIKENHDKEINEKIEQVLKEYEKNNPPSNNNNNNNNNKPSVQSTNSNEFIINVRKRLKSHSKFIFQNDIAVRRLIALALQLKHAVEQPTQSKGCPLGWNRIHETCYFVGPKATFLDNKKYCDLFNASMIKVNSTMQQQAVVDLTKPIEKPVWIDPYSSSMAFDTQDSFKNNECVVFDPSDGKMLIGKCGETNFQMCEIEVNEKKYLVRDFSERPVAQLLRTRRSIENEDEKIESEINEIKSRINTMLGDFKNVQLEMSNEKYTLYSAVIVSAIIAMIAFIATYLIKKSK